ncbi:MAG: hypothetical protein IJA55_00475 [Clostridia bacterium]|nr:hypothetical protein [Clostridia bacterium]
MLKKTKFFVGITLLVQSVTFLTIFVILWAKQKSLWRTFLIVGLAGGVAGTLLTYKAVKEDKQFKAMMAAVDNLCDYEDAGEVDDFEIMTDDSATEEDFE